MLFLSQGTPHFLAGDEMGNSQSGNNNGYCQDNEISWLNWQMSTDDKNLFDFTCAVIKLRQRSQLLTDIYYQESNAESKANFDDVTWYHPNGHVMKMTDWHDNNAQVISVALKGIGHIDEHWLLIMNASNYNISATIPVLESKYAWVVAIDTQCSDGKITNDDSYHSDSIITISSRSLIVLQRKIRK
jgi:glycogen operon protein